MNDALAEFAQKHSTDKWTEHNYIPHYETFLKSLKDDPIHLLEIGVGGYEHPDRGGESLRMWKDYFPNGSITSIDIFDKSSIEEDRIKIYRGSQIDESLLNLVDREAGPFDIIIDDGSHINNHIIKSFEMLFPKLKQNGIYIIEDIQTAYWPQYGGDSFNLQNKKTAMNYFKCLVDGLNHVEFDNPYFRPDYFDENIVSISFFHNMVFVQKGANDESSNFITNNLRPTDKPVKSKIKYFLRNLVNHKFFKLW